MFTPAQLKERIRMEPFVPLRIVTSSGESYVVTHPELLWVGVRDVHVGRASKKDPATYDQVARIAMMHITALEDLPASKPKKSNGQ